MTKTYRVTYRTRPLGLNPKYLDSSVMPISGVDIEADSVIDALSKYSAYQHKRNIEATGYTNDILDVKEVV